MCAVVGAPRSEECVEKGDGIDVSKSAYIDGSEDEQDSEG